VARVALRLILTVQWEPKNPAVPLKALFYSNLIGTLHGLFVPAIDNKVAISLVPDIRPQRSDEGKRDGRKRPPNDHSTVRARHAVPAFVAQASLLAALWRETFIWESEMGLFGRFEFLRKRELGAPQNRCEQLQLFRL
jgi:hypothetical protein